MFQARPTKLLQIELKLLSSQDLQHVKDMVELRRRSNQIVSLVKRSRSVGFAPDINQAIGILNKGLECLELSFLEHLREETPEALKDADTEQGEGI